MSNRATLPYCFQQCLLSQVPGAKLTMKAYGERYCQGGGPSRYGQYVQYGQYDGTQTDRVGR
jgi:hypothetical protein